MIADGRYDKFGNYEWGECPVHGDGSLHLATDDLVQCGTCGEPLTEEERANAVALADLNH